MYHSLHSVGQLSQ